ncbi:uncharacterized protein F4807DRAFT_420344 [Annulohypoxylon truncatum]|uniref:uncharacterized protein n=1 Tax=Annulohypoxylon truncatum TaxID=327061 RepID=UPI0020072C44|nr:uncharacterized protein F4807DRAFT_420344 [Annulohypoxylon truncatum]KAI1211421.1 hypothetical protein F4807DRAFT_420344 [Annulohypoxylon truncatum]
MCEEAGIVPPGEDAYTSRAPTPLTAEQTQWVLALIEERRQHEASAALPQGTLNALKAEQLH